MGEVHDAVGADPLGRHPGPGIAQRLRGQGVLAIRAVVVAAEADASLAGRDEAPMAAGVAPHPAPVESLEELSLAGQPREDPVQGGYAGHTDFHSTPHHYSFWIGRVDQVWKPLPMLGPPGSATVGWPTTADYATLDGGIDDMAIVTVPRSGLEDLHGADQPDDGRLDCL